MFAQKKLFVASAFAAAALFSNASATADTLLDTANFNVTLNLTSAHALTVTDLTFGTINPTLVQPNSAALTSTSGAVYAYSNSISGQYVKVVASAPEYLSSGGYNFLMVGQTSGNSDTIEFFLQSSTNPDGSPAPGGAANYFNGSELIAVDGTDANHAQNRDLWAILTTNAQLLSIASDAYLAVLTLNHYSYN